MIIIDQWASTIDSFNRLRRAWPRSIEMAIADTHVRTADSGRESAPIFPDLYDSFSRTPLSTSRSVVTDTFNCADANCE